MSSSAPPSFNYLWTRQAVESCANLEDRRAEGEGRSARGAAGENRAEAPPGQLTPPPGPGG